MAYSMDFRRRVVEACDEGMKTRQVAQVFNVAPSWVRRLKQWRRERGSIAPRPCGGSEPKLGPAEQPAIHAHFAEHPDTTIVELKAALGADDVSEVSVWRAARRLGYRFKKSRSTRRNAGGRTWPSGVGRGRSDPIGSTRVV